jgi:hypothetical protein
MWKQGKPVRLHFSNPDVTEHNLLILDQGTSIQEIGEAANRMAADPEAAKKGIHSKRQTNPPRHQTPEERYRSKPFASWLPKSLGNILFSALTPGIGLS